MVEKIGIRAAAIIIKNNKVLLVNSRYSDGEYYLFPGGGVESQETVEEAAVRETLEETGIKIEIKKLVHVNEYIFESEKNRISIAMFFLSEQIGKDSSKIINDNGKIQSIEWIDIDKLNTVTIYPKALVDSLIKYKDKLPLEYSVSLKKYI